MVNRSFLVNQFVSVHYPGACFLALLLIAGCASNKSVSSPASSPQSGGSSSSQSFVYASDQSSNQLSGWQFNGNALAALSGSPYAAGSGPDDLALSANGQFLYGVMTQQEPGVPGSSCTASPDELDAWSIDQSTGTLTLIQQLSLHDSCGYLAMDPAGDFLYVTERSLQAASSDGFVEVISLDSSTGKMTLASGSPYQVAQAPMAAAVSGCGCFLYAVQQAQGNSAGIMVFSRDEDTGAVQYVTTVPATGGAQDRLVASPYGNWLYRLAQNTGTLTTYAIDTTTGNLTQLSTNATAANATRVAADSTGSYVAAATAEGVYVFAVNSSSGALTPIAGSPFGGAAVSVSFDPPGEHFVVLSTNSSGNMQVNVYTLAGSSATLQATASAASYAADAVMVPK